MYTGHYLKPVYKIFVSYHPTRSQYHAQPLSYIFPLQSVDNSILKRNASQLRRSRTRSISRGVYMSSGLIRSIKSSFPLLCEMLPFELLWMSFFSFQHCNSAFHSENPRFHTLLLLFTFNFYIIIIFIYDIVLFTSQFCFGGTATTLYQVHWHLIKGVLF